MHGRDETFIQNSGRENLKRINDSEDLGIGVSGKIILKWILGKYGGSRGLDAPGSE